MDGSVLIDGDAKCITANMSTIGNQVHVRGRECAGARVCAGARMYGRGCASTSFLGHLGHHCIYQYIEVYARTRTHTL